jgi:hypothetical protein
MASVPVPQPRPPLRRTRRPATRFLLAIAVALFLGLILASLLWLPDVIVRLDLDPRAPEPLTQADGLTAHNDVREVLLQGVGGLALLLGVAAGAWATLRQIQVSQEGQITERFTRAIEQLGSTEVDVRIGGLYALQRIAEDAPVERGPIIEVLSAYVRNRNPWPPAAGPDDNGPDVAHLRVRAPDVQTAMNVLGHAADWHGDGAAGIQLGAVDLRRAYLIRAELPGAYLHGAQLDGAWLRGGRLAGINLHQASLRSALLRDADLTEADLRRADLRGAMLEGADLRGARLDGARLDGARVSDSTRFPEGAEPVEITRAG